MNLEDQIVNLELSKKLKELGVEQNSLFYWTKPKDKFWREDDKKYNDFNVYINTSRYPYFDINYKSITIHGCGCCEESEDSPEFFSAFTVAELGEMLPYFVIENQYRLNFYKNEDGYFCDYINIHYGHSYKFENTNLNFKSEADSRASTLICLIENKLMEISK